MRSQLFIDRSRYLREHAATLHLDAARIAVYGQRYGGLVAVHALVRDRQSARLRCVAVAEPVTDLRHHRALITERYMNNVTENGPQYDAADIGPLSAEVRDRTLLLVHGARRQARLASQRWARQLELADVQFEQVARRCEQAEQYEEVARFIDRCFAVGVEC